jgi:hypothetical protein
MIEDCSPDLSPAADEKLERFVFAVAMATH